MIFKYLNHFKFIIFFSFIFINNSYSEIIKSIEIKGNNRISNKTIEMFSNISIGDNIKSNDLNDILKNIYETDFFENVSVTLEKNKLLINVIENPIIESITYEGIKAKKIRDVVFKDLKLKPRSSFIKIFLHYFNLITKKCKNNAEKDRNLLLIFFQSNFAIAFFK